MYQRKRKYSDCTVWLCPVCDAEIDPWANIMKDYAYKHFKGRTGQDIFFCSWTCMRKWEKLTGYKPKEILTRHVRKRDEIDKEVFG